MNATIPADAARDIVRHITLKALRNTDLIVELVTDRVGIELADADEMNIRHAARTLAAQIATVRDTDVTNAVITLTERARAAARQDNDAK